MSFSKIGPGGGWPLGGKLTSAQANALDGDHAMAVDGSVAGDVLHGTLTFDGTTGVAQVNANIAAAIVASAGGGIKALAAKGIVATVADGIAAGIAGGIGDGGIAGGIATTTAGGFSLGGGAGDYPTFSAARNLVRSRRLRPAVGAASGWTYNNGNVSYLIGPGTNAEQNISLDFLVEGATLTQLVIGFFVGNSHSGGISSLVMPTFSLRAYPLSFAANFSTYLALSSTDPQQIANPGSGAAWYASGDNQYYLYTCDQNNVIDTGRYLYELVIVDENGTGAQSGNAYTSLTPTYQVSQLAYP